MDDGNYIIWISMFFIILSVIYTTYQHYVNVQQAQRLRKRRRGGKTAMSEALQAFVGKECTVVVAAVSGTVIRGTVKSVEDGWLTLMSGRPGAERINTFKTDFILRIEERKR
jgi:hypothetical protein